MKRFLPKSEFSRNVLTLMTGTTVAQAIPISISPILTRIYTPEDFGVFALFLSISIIFGSIANGRYELAIMLPETDEDAINIAALGVIISLSLSIFLLLIIVLFNAQIAAALGNQEIGVWLYFIPVSVFFIGLFNVLNFTNNRLKKYKDIALANIYKSVALAVVQLTVGFAKAGPCGLISGQLVSNVFANIRLLKNITKSVQLKKVLSTKKMICLAKRHIGFPKYTLWATLANTMSQHLTNILIPTFFAVSTLGQYSLVQRALGVPSSLVGNSIGQVYFRTANEERRETGSATNIFIVTVKKLFILSTPIFIILFFVIEDVFVFVFGEAWAEAGLYAKLLLPLFAIRFVFSPVSITFSTFEKQKLALLLQIGLMVFSVAVIVAMGSMGQDFQSFVSWYSAITTSYYMFFLYITYLVATRKI